MLIDSSFETIASGSYEWENLLEDGIWTYNLVDIITGLQTAYSEMKKKLNEIMVSPFAKLVLLDFLQ